MKHSIRLLLATLSMTLAILAVQSQNARALAGSCDCSGWVQAYEYPDTFVASNSYGFQNQFQPSALSCSWACASYMNQRAKDMCNTYGLNGGVGYVIRTFNWRYELFTSGGTGEAGQQYDCDDL